MANDAVRFIIVTNSPADILQAIRYDDYTEIEHLVYVYVVNENKVTEEFQLVKTYRLL